MTAKVTTNPGAFKKGEKRPNQGRPKGVLNKTNQALREMILQALAEQDGGGVGYLKLQAIENPGPFMVLLGKVLPTTLAGDSDAPPIDINHTVTFVLPTKGN